MPHFDLSLLTALAVFFHMGTSVARTVLKDNTDRAKIDKIDAGVSQVLGALGAVASVLQAPPSSPASAPAHSPANVPTNGGTPPASGGI